MTEATMLPLRWFCSLTVCRPLANEQISDSTQDCQCCSLLNIAGGFTTVYKPNLTARIHEQLSFACTFAWYIKSRSTLSFVIGIIKIQAIYNNASELICLTIPSKIKIACTWLDIYFALFQARISFSFRQ